MTNDPGTAPTAFSLKGKPNQFHVAPTPRPTWTTQPSSPETRLRAPTSEKVASKGVNDMERTVVVTWHRRLRQRQRRRWKNSRT